jgi:glycosyltransferase involved in cell wall biosynthesis
MTTRSVNGTAQAARDAMVLVTPKVPPARNGVGDYTYALGKELARTGRVAIVTSSDQHGEREDHAFSVLPIVPRWDLAGLRLVRRAAAELDAPVINLQWVPFLWGRRGINLAMPLAVAALRRAGFRVVTTVHEPYVPLNTWRRCVYGPVQRLELAVIATHSAKVVATTPVFADLVTAVAPWRKRDVSWIPVCSTIPMLVVTPAERARLRDSLGVTDDGVLVAAFSPLGSGKIVSAIFEAWQAISRDAARARLLVIGATAEEVAQAYAPARDVAGVTYTGYCDPDNVSRLLSSADLFLAPLLGGISTRNTSVLTAMEHGLAIVTTRGAMTDAETFGSAPMAMVDDAATGAFVAAAVRLAREGAERARMAAAITGFHRRHFDRRVIAERLRAVAELS